MAILTLDKIKDYYSKYCEVVSFIAEINISQPENQKIKNIQVPVSLSQSLAYHFLQEIPSSINLEEITVDLLKEGNNRTFDLIYNGERKVNIEVKATGTKKFQRFRKKALSADYVIWINFTSITSYEIAVFNPIILNPNERIEREFDWNKLNGYSNIVFYRNREL